jgi:hypothetical protein
MNWIVAIILALILTYIVGRLVYGYLQRNAPVMDDDGTYWPPIK